MMIHTNRALIFFIRWMPDGSGRLVHKRHQFVYSSGGHYFVNYRGVKRRVMQVPDGWELIVNERGGTRKACFKLVKGRLYNLKGRLYESRGKKPPL